MLGCNEICIMTRVQDCMMEEEGRVCIHRAREKLSLYIYMSRGREQEFGEQSIKGSKRAKLKE